MKTLALTIFLSSLTGISACVNISSSDSGKGAVLSSVEGRHNLGQSTPGSLGSFLHNRQRELQNKP